MTAKSSEKNQSRSKNHLSPSPPSEYLTLNPPSVRKDLVVDTIDLPSSYNRTQLTLIARDPFWIHAYWEIAEDSFDQVKRKIGQGCDQARLTLRMYDVTLIDFHDNNANHWFDIDVGYSKSWYVNLWSDSVSYCADIGMKTPDGRFFAIARSNFVTTPRVQMSSRNDMIWMEVNDQKQSQPFVYLEKAGAKGRHPLAGAKGQQILTPRQRKRLLLTENDIRNYYAKLFPLLKLLKKVRSLTELGNSLLDKDLEDRDPENRWRLEQARLAKLEEEMRRSQWHKRIGASEEIMGGATESLFSQNQQAQASEQNFFTGPRKFFFEIGTELIVYGRTEPSASVWLGDQPIKLREDGTFTLRYALPDGKIPFDFLAQSFDKLEERRISTSVERTKTIYNP